MNLLSFNHQPAYRTTVWKLSSKLPLNPLLSEVIIPTSTFDKYLSTAEVLLLKQTLLSYLSDILHFTSELSILAIALNDALREIEVLKVSSLSATNQS